MYFTRIFSVNRRICANFDDSALAEKEDKKRGFRKRDWKKFPPRHGGKRV